MASLSKFKQVMNSFKGAGVGICLLTMVGTANAAFIDLTGTVTGGGAFDPVPAAPFTIGDLLTGFIEIRDDAATAGSSFDVSDLLGFNVTVGLANFSLPTASPFGFFNGTISEDGRTLTQLNATTEFATYPGCGFCNLTLNADADSFLVILLDQFGFAEGFDFKATVRQQAVPEPASVLLFGAGLLGLGLARIRRT
ncbi:MAG: PEP-CTERM sorting domain-containing protein [Marinobacter sp.]|nr:PEP-CTERM sorting domain-containing protein [Marinobacter sp.]